MADALSMYTAIMVTQTNTMLAAKNKAEKELLCKTVEADFSKTTATVEQKQEYAECINTLYPKYTERGEYHWIATVLLLGIIVGTVANFFSDIWSQSLTDRFFGIFVGAFFGFFGAAVLIAFVALAEYVVKGFM